MAQPLALLIRDANAVLIADGNLDAIERFFSPEYVVNITGQRIAGGHDIVRKALGSILKSFPDIQVEINVLLEGEDRIAWLRTLKGTHEVAFKGFPGSGQEIIWCDMVTSEIQDGKIIQEWVVTDLAERLLLSRKKIVSIKPNITLKRDVPFRGGFEGLLFFRLRWLRLSS